MVSTSKLLASGLSSLAFLREYPLREFPPNPPAPGAPYPVSAPKPSSPNPWDPPKPWLSPLGPEYDPLAAIVPWQ